jgi:hypothetical protein
MKMTEQAQVIISAILPKRPLPARGIPHLGAIPTDALLAGVSVKFVLESYMSSRLDSS